MRLVLTCIVALNLLPLQAQQAPSADALARRLQQRYQDIRDFEADFTQTIRGGPLNIKSRAKGHVYVKKPGRMKWVYSEPERYELTMDGKKVYTYYHEDGYATESDASDDQASTSLLFLAGKGDILRDFTPSLSAGAPAGTVGLKLTPRQPEPGFEYFVVVLDEKTARLRSLTTRDNVGAETTTDFSRLRENTAIDDRVFNPPKGVKVVR
jgi:outer membrane lipoprotein carrier protein